MDFESDIDYDDSKCHECGQDSIGYCKPCNSGHFCDNFAHWTSGDSNLDELIQNVQLDTNNCLDLIEWIEYSNLENIELIAHGGFRSVYKTIWKDGPIIDYNPWKRKWQRKGQYYLKNGGRNYVIDIYGVTRDLQNREYAIVTDFKDGGNLREFIKKDHSELTWKKIITSLAHSIWTLWNIHDKNYYCICLM
ncbi:hypothetical protein C1646_758417 [Rhizophagus diaphanus]|nr:hypothetical protein C1646_758417 [Rhizophagus diaphanus] [Rhizophagus sp. MUCL 43196]